MREASGNTALQDKIKEIMDPPDEGSANRRRPDMDPHGEVWTGTERVDLSEEDSPAIECAIKRYGRHALGKRCLRHGRRVRRTPEGQLTCGGT